MTTVSIYLSYDDIQYIKENDLSPSGLMKKAILLHKEGEIKLDKYYIEEIDKLKLVIKKLQNTITTVGDNK